MTPMPALSVTIGRDRRPGSAVAPREPLPDNSWTEFQADVLAAMRQVDTAGHEPEIRDGRTWYDGRWEQCRTISLLWADPPAERLAVLRTELAAIACRYDQDALVLHIEARHLIAA